MWPPPRYRTRTKPCLKILHYHLGCPSRCFSHVVLSLLYNCTQLCIYGTPATLPASRYVLYRDITLGQVCHSGTLPCITFGCDKIQTTTYLGILRRHCAHHPVYHVRVYRYKQALTGSAGGAYSCNAWLYGLCRQPVMFQNSALLYRD